MEKLIDRLITTFLNATNLIKNRYNFILVMIDHLIKMVCDKLITTIMNISGLVKIIIDMVLKHFYLKKFVVTDKNSFLSFKIWSLLYFFSHIK